jgi:uncharacterized protein involved in exopolysaccharide biosynthesis
MAETGLERELDPRQQLRQVLGVLRRGWLAIATFLGVGLLVGVGLYHFIPKTYVSTGKLLARSRWMFESAGEARLLDDLPFTARARQLEDELRSTAWVEAVLDKLEWPEWARAKGRGELERRQFAQKVKDGITARVVPGETGERLVLVNFAWTDRARAAFFCRELIDHWLKTAVETYEEKLDRELAVSEELRSRKEGDVEQAEQALEQFEKRHEISAINQRQNTQQRHDALQLELDRLSGEIAALEAQIEQIDRDLAAVDADGKLLLPATLPDISTEYNTEKITRLAEIQRHVTEIEALKARGFTETWPALRQLKERLQILLKETSEQPTTIEVEVPAVPNPAWELKKAQRDDLYVLQQGRLAEKLTKETDLSEVHSALQTLPEILRQHSSLQEDVAIRRQIAFEHTLAMQPLKDRKQELARKSEGQKLPFQILEQPVPAPSPSTAIGWLALVISTVLGLGLALAVVVGRELLRSSFSSAEQARRTLKLPVLGEVAPIQTVLEVRRARFVRALQIAASLTLLAGIGAAIWACVAYPQDLPRGLVEWAQDLRELLS